MADLEQLTNALRKADQAGDTQAAKMFADEIRRMREGANPDGTFGQPPEGMVLNPETGQMVDTAAIAERQFGSGVGKAIAGGARFASGFPVIGAALEAHAGLGDPVKQGVADQAFKQFDEANPKTSTALKIGGGIAGTVPMIAAAPGAFGAGGGGFWANTGASAASGTALGAADAAVRSRGDLEATKSGAAWGGGLGLVGPTVGKVTGALVGKAAEYVGPLASKAQKMFARSAGADAVDDIAARAAQLGDDALPMDLGPNLQQRAGGVASTPGRGQAIVRNAMTARDAGANARIRGTLDDTLGQAQPPSHIEATIEANKAALGPSYDQVFAGRNVTSVDVEPIAQNLDAMVTRLRGPAQKAAREVRNMLNIVGTDQLDTNPRTLHEIRQAIDGIIETSNSKTVNVLKVVRQQIDNKLARAVPGIKKVDAKWQELQSQADAVKTGQKVLESGRTAPWPVEVAEQYRQGGLPKGVGYGPSAEPLRLRQGARAEIERIVGNKANDRVALQQVIKGEGDWNRDRLATLFGREKADKIINLLDREKTFAESSNIITRNSLTASRSAVQKDTAEQVAQPGVLQTLGDVKPGTATVKFIDKFRGDARAAKHAATNTELAEILTSTERATDAIRRVQGMRNRGEISGQVAREAIQAITLGTGSQSAGIKPPPVIQGGGPRSSINASHFKIGGNR